jgi:cytoskeletal protein RodZ
MVAAVEVPAIEEPAVAAPVVFAEDAEEVVVEASEVDEPASPTILMASPEEIAEPQPVSIDFSDTAAIEPEAVPPPAPPVVEPEPPPPVALAPPPLPPLPAAPVSPPPIAVKPPGSVPPLPAARPAAPVRPPAPRSAPRPSAGAPPARREVRHAAPPHPAPPPAEAEPEAVEAPAPSPGGRRSMLLALAGFAGVLVLAGLGWVAWRFLAGPSRPRPTPAPVARATAPPETRPRPTSTPQAVEPTPEPTTAPTPLATPTPAATPRPGATPTPAATPTPRATPTPTPATARPTPTPPPTPAGPSAEAVRAQQAAAQAQALVAQAETAIGARQYDAAVSHLDGALRLEPANARATSLRADAVRRRDLARRRFAPGRTAVQTQKAQKASGPAGFDTEDAEVRSSDFLGRVEFEMSPATGLEAGDAWTLRVYVVNEGKKAIRVQGVTVATSVNGAASGGPVPPRAREVAPQQRSLVAETTGSWRDGTTAWATEATVTAAKNESLKNTLTWR